MRKETPLLGLPLTVKESIKVSGMSNQSGRVYKKKLVATEDAPVVRNAKKHGAVILCVTNTPELCLCWETYNNVHGTTKNPYDLKR
jgi:fatty acid amide hydrolase 2